MNQEEALSGRLMMRLFGGFEVEVGGQPLPKLRSQTGLRLLAYFAVNHGKRIERTTVKGVIWPEEAVDPEKALQMTLANLRRALGHGRPLDRSGRLFSPERRWLQFEPQEGDDLDIADFDRAIDQAVRFGSDVRLQAAMRLYRGPLLAGWEEPWVRAAREERSRRYIQALERFRGQAMVARDYEAALLYLRGSIRAEVQEGTGWRELIRAHIDRGDHDQAYAVYKALEQAIREVKPPSPETKQELKRIPIAVLKQLKERYARLSSFSIDILPRSDVLIGRDEALRDIQSLLHGSPLRLIVLTGSGGVGKTRLAIQVGHQAEVRLGFPHGVKFVDLASVNCPSAVIAKNAVVFTFR